MKRGNPTPAEILANLLAAPGMRAGADDLVRMLGRGAVTPLFLFEASGLESRQGDRPAHSR